jgi:hypothetical protein
MRTYSCLKVKHFSPNARDIHHVLRDSWNNHRIRGDASEETHHDVRIARATRMTPLADGNYDAFIVWAEPRDDGVALELTITTGSHRGDVVNVVTSTFAQRDALDLVGLPCTLVVHGEELRIIE